MEGIQGQLVNKTFGQIILGFLKQNFAPSGWTRSEWECWESEKGSPEWHWEHPSLPHPGIPLHVHQPCLRHRPSLLQVKYLNLQKFVKITNFWSESLLEPGFSTLLSTSWSSRSPAEPLPSLLASLSTSSWLTRSSQHLCEESGIRKKF